MDFLPDPFFESFHVFKQFPSNLKLVPFFDCGLEVSKLAKVVEVLPGQPDKTMMTSEFINEEISMLFCSKKFSGGWWVVVV